MDYKISQAKVSAAKVLKRPCGRLIPFILLPSFLSRPQAPPSLPSSPLFLPCPLLLSLPSPSQPVSSVPFSPLISRTPKIQRGGLGEYCTWAPPAESGAESQSKSNLGHFSLNIRHLVATILTILLRINWPNVVIAGDFSDAAGEREMAPECGSLPRDAGDLARLQSARDWHQIVLLVRVYF